VYTADVAYFPVHVMCGLSSDKCVIYFYCNKLRWKPRPYTFSAIRVTISLMLKELASDLFMGETHRNFDIKAFLNLSVM
jgi:hypothetical protein